MSPFQTLVYTVLLQLIQAYRCIEVQILKLFTPLLIRVAKRLGHSIGVIVHCPEDKEWTKLDSENILSCCKYDTLLHMYVRDIMVFSRIASGGSLGFAETYMEGMWECANEGDIQEITNRTLECNLMDLYWNRWNWMLEWVETSAFNLQEGGRAFQVGKVHYDLGNDLYKSILDPWLQYTTGYWKGANTLDEAQVNKMRLIGEKLDLKPGMRVLDIGCGWGTLCKYLAENYKVECVGITISVEGVEYGRTVNKGLPVEIRLQDYRDLDEKFDRIVSVGMFEHVGFRNYKRFFEVVCRCLKPDGVFLLHTIGREHSNVPRSEIFLHRYIFPNGNLPNPRDLTTSTQGLLIMEDWHNFGLDYTKTLEAWRHNFIKNWSNIGHTYGDTFYRMWIFYLSLAAGMFKSRRLHVYQIVYSKDGLKEAYRSVR